MPTLTDPSELKQIGTFPDVLRRIVVVDLETSGLDPNAHGILEIGAVALEIGAVALNPCPTLTFEREVRLEWHAEWDPKAAEVHGLTREEVANHRRTTDSVAVEDFLDWLEDVVIPGIEGRAVIAGMNPRFDRDFLCTVATRADLDARFRGLVSHRTIDLHTLAVGEFWREINGWTGMFPRGIDSLDSDKIYALLGMHPEARPHRALAGARHEAKALLALLDTGHGGLLARGAAGLADQPSPQPAA